MIENVSSTPKYISHSDPGLGGLEVSAGVLMEAISCLVLEHDPRVTVKGVGPRELSLDISLGVSWKYHVIILGSRL